MMSFTACNSNDGIDGGWDDIIKPSTTAPAIDASGGVASVTTANDGWWIESIEVNGKTIQPEYTLRSVDKEYITVAVDWLTVERTDGKTLKLSAEKNYTNKTRTAVIYLQAGNYFGTIVVTQENAYNSMALEYSNDGIIWQGDTRTIEIKTAGDFTFNSFEDDIASVQAVDNKSFILTAKKEGITVLPITDSKGNNTQFIIFVVSDLHGDWQEVANRSTSEIVVNDAKIKQQIQAEVNKWKGAFYGFRKYNHTFFVLSDVPTSSLNKGQYDFSIEAKTLTLNYNGITEAYNITTAPNRYRDIQLDQDMTDYYKALYPDAGVEKVTVSKVFSTDQFVYIYTDANGRLYYI